MWDGSRRVHALVLLAAAAGVLGSAREARAGTTVDLVFRDSNLATLTIASPGGTYLADVVLTTTDDLAIGSASVGWDPSGGLSVASGTIAFSAASAARARSPSSRITVMTNALSATY